MLGSGQEVLFILCFFGDSRCFTENTASSLYPGPWEGTVVHMGMGVVATVTKEKWQKTRELILESDVLVREGRLPQK